MYAILVNPMRECIAKSMKQVPSLGGSCYDDWLNTVPVPCSTKIGFRKQYRKPAGQRKSIQFHICSTHFAYRSKPAVCRTFCFILD